MKRVWQTIPLRSSAVPGWPATAHLPSVFIPETHVYVLPYGRLTDDDDKDAADGVDRQQAGFPRRREAMPAAHLLSEPRRTSHIPRHVCDVQAWLVRSPAPHRAPSALLLLPGGEPLSSRHSSCPLALPGPRLAACSGQPAASSEETCPQTDVQYGVRFIYNSYVVLRPRHMTYLRLRIAPLY